MPLDQFSARPRQESRFYRSCVSLYTSSRHAHSDTLVCTYARTYTGLSSAITDVFGNGGMQVPVLVVVGTYTRSSLPGELEFLAADRILLRESRDTHDIQDMGIRLQELMRTHTCTRRLLLLVK